MGVSPRQVESESLISARKSGSSVTTLKQLGRIKVCSKKKLNHMRPSVYPTAVLHSNGDLSMVGAADLRVHVEPRHIPVSCVELWVTRHQPLQTSVILVASLKHKQVRSILSTGIWQ